jgi:hypothetical protein
MGKTNAMGNTEMGNTREMVNIKGGCRAGWFSGLGIRELLIPIRGTGGRGTGMPRLGLLIALRLMAREFVRGGFILGRRLRGI